MNRMQDLVFAGKIIIYYGYGFTARLGRDFTSIIRPPYHISHACCLWWVKWKFKSISGKFPPVDWPWELGEEVLEAYLTIYMYLVFAGICSIWFVNLRPLAWKSLNSFFLYIFYFIFIFYFFFFPRHCYVWFMTVRLCYSYRGR